MHIYTVSDLAEATFPSLPSNKFLFNRMESFWQEHALYTLGSAEEFCRRDIREHMARTCYFYDGKGVRQSELSSS